MTIVKVVELVGSSPESWHDAVQRAVEAASHTLRKITGVDVIKQTAHVEDGKITEYRATINVAFVVEHHSHLLGAAASAPD